MFKRIFPVGLVYILVISIFLAGCGNVSKKDNSKESDVNNKETSFSKSDANAQNSGTTADASNAQNVGTTADSLNTQNDGTTQDNINVADNGNADDNGQTGANQGQEAQEGQSEPEWTEPEQDDSWSEGDSSGDYSSSGDSSYEGDLSGDDMSSDSSGENSSGGDTSSDSSGGNSSSGGSTSGGRDFTNENELMAWGADNATKYLEYEQRVLDIVNSARASVGAPPLKLDMTLCTAANMRAIEMDYGGYFDHRRYNGDSCFSVYTTCNIGYYSAAENIAYGQSSPEEVMECWINSKGHYGNIINSNLTSIGVGYSCDNGRAYWVQLFKG